MAAVYDKLTRVLDRLIPDSFSTSCRRRPTDLWFEVLCHAAKRLTRRLERAYATADAAAARVAWYDQQKCRAFWAELIVRRTY